MGKKVLFLAPKVANIYLDIIAELERQQYEVDYFEYKSYKLDPHYLIGYVKYGRVFTSNSLSSYFIRRDWKRMLESPQYNKTYDYLFVIDGNSLHPYLFNTLRSRNPNIKTINYLFDSTYSVYEFNVQFQYFDIVYTFDIGDSIKYGINLLPIFWPLLDKRELPQDIDLFGMGSDIGIRFRLFSILDDYSKKKGLNSFIRILLRPVKNINRYKWKYRIIETLSSKSVMTPPNHLNSPIITSQFISTAEYIQMIRRSKVIVDSNPLQRQDGLTARFMWALGAEKKIITTNAMVKKYDFYTPEQIYVVEDVENFITDSAFESFMNSEYHMSDDVRSKIETYRIDNWIKLLFK